MITIPLVRGFRPGSVFAYREGRAVGVETFLGDASRLAAELPERQHVLNLCVEALPRNETGKLPQPALGRIAPGFAPPMEHGRL